MGAYNKYDPRLEDLVVETKTQWDDSVADLKKTIGTRSPERFTPLRNSPHKSSTNALTPALHAL